MGASSWERDIAINVVESMIRSGLSALYTAERRPYGLWDWLDDNKLFEQGISYADGATKAVIFHDDLDSYVIKFRLPREDPSMDYCAREYDNYVLAEEAGLSYYFAETEYLCEREGIVFYLQEQVICDEAEVDGEICSKLQCQYEESNTPYDLDSLWSEVDEMSAYDRTMLLYDNKALSDFIVARRINDLHGGNFGMAGDHYVILDYSGFGPGVWR